MATFEPPIGSYNPSTLPWDKNAVPFRYYQGTPKGTNIYVKPDGTVVENYDPGNATHIYLGGHIYTDLSASEVTTLESAGYTVVT